MLQMNSCRRDLQNPFGEIEVGEFKNILAFLMLLKASLLMVADGP